MIFLYLLLISGGLFALLFRYVMISPMIVTGVAYNIFIAFWLITLSLGALTGLVGIIAYLRSMDSVLHVFGL